MPGLSKWEIRRARRRTARGLGYVEPDSMPGSAVGTELARRGFMIARRDEEIRRLRAALGWPA